MNPLFFQQQRRKQTAYSSRKSKRIVYMYTLQYIATLVAFLFVDSISH